MKVTKKINHDSMWIKALDASGWTKLLINRSGTKVTSTSGRGAVTAMHAIYRKAMRKGMTNGEALDFIEARLSA